MSVILEVYEPDQHPDDLPVLRYTTEHPDPIRVARRFLRFWNNYYGQPGGCFPAFIRIEVYGDVRKTVRERRRS